MRPAYSVILLTTLIGAGQGLFLALFAVQGLTFVGVLPPPAPAGFLVLGGVVALALTAAGLVASFFHLGRPERAWRSAAQWRTSWLSREVIALPAFLGALALYVLLQASGWSPALFRLESGLVLDLALLVGGVATLLALALFVCTGMVYACMRFLAEWHTPLTPLNFALMGAASGSTLATALAATMVPQYLPFLAGSAAALTALAAVARGASLWRNARLKPRSTVQSAIGIKHPTIVQRSMGFMGGSFNTQEFFHGRGLKWLRGVKWAFLLFAFALPLLCLWLGVAAGSGAALALAVVLQVLGLLAERWFFLAQANHPQNLYYQVLS